MVQMDQAEFRNLIKKSYCKNTTDLEFMLFIEQCKNLKLNPMAGQISMIKIWDTTVNSEVAIAVVRIDGFRSIAHRTGQFAGRIGPSGAETMAFGRIFGYQANRQQQHALEYYARIARTQFGELRCTRAIADSEKKTVLRWRCGQRCRK